MSEIRVDRFKAEDGISAPQFPNGINVTGVVTATVLNGTVPYLTVGSNAQAGAAGIVTAKGANINGDLDVDGHTNLDNVNISGVTSVASLTQNRVTYGGSNGKLQDSGNLTFDGSTLAVTGDASISGKLSVGSTLTYEDVTNIDSVGIITARLGVRVPDNVYSYFGTGNDLSIRHDASGGNHSYIFNSGAGVFKLGSNTQFIIGKTSNATYIQANPDGDVKLYYNNNQKLATSNTGVTVTGTLAATAVTGDGSGLTNLAVGLSTEALVKTNGQTATLNLSKDDHKVTATGTVTIDTTGGTESENHTLRIVNNGTATINFSSKFLFPSGGSPNLPTASGAISLISFTVHQTTGTVKLLAGASVNFS